MESGLRHFGERGYEAASVIEIARDANVTTGSLYHHFESKRAFFVVIRTEVQRRVRDRMEGAWAAVAAGAAGAGGREEVAAALLVGFDAAVHFHSARLLSEPIEPEDDVLAAVLEPMLGPAPRHAGGVVMGAWRAALAAVAAGTPAPEARAGLEWLLTAP